MTFINVTVAEDRKSAVMSCDGALEGSPAEGGDRRVSKIFALPHLRMVAAGSGQGAPLLDAIVQLHFSHAAASDLSDIYDSVPSLLRDMAARHPGAAFRLFIIGWVQGADPADGRALGFAYLQERNFSPISLSGLVIGQPHIDEADPENAAAVAALRSPGRDPERFHRLMLAAQMREWRAGKYRKDAVAGGPYTIARIDARGITLKTIEEGALLEHAALARAAAA